MVLIIFPATIVLASFSLLLLSKLSFSLGLVDKPSQRKRHEGEVPLIGGISFFFTLSFLCTVIPNLIPNHEMYLIGGLILTLLGAVDDRFDIRASTRIVMLIALSVWLVSAQNISLVNLGDLWGYGNVSVESWDVLFTMIALIGAVTAFNMVDGVDGLLGMLASITLLSLSVLFFIQGESRLAVFCLVCVCALVPFLMCNLSKGSSLVMKIFMGDSGSTLLGFTIVWMFIHGSQVGLAGLTQVAVKPVIVLWLIAVPLMDMGWVVLRRVLKGKSPFKADRLHLHHICMRLGLSSTQTLIVLSSIAILLAAFGVWAQTLNVKESWMMWGFLSLFVTYCALMHTLKVMIKRRVFRPKRKTCTTPISV
uniref:UDP-N-acetylglucosamine--undecaprenyl-phosphate N-acetylglucosaminephosphotransferase n=1 Tax=Thaumasiovibrio occultus TaxID=1891184 RepID=UPI000B34C0FD|nr:UDP-N-acetylglucosamine--undecaprenyl-phosphate N-acetylglucosaminephosphotransferase [Thaumasiovibrio occultus]